MPDQTEDYTGIPASDCITVSLTGSPTLFELLLEEGQLGRYPIGVAIAKAIDLVEGNGKMVVIDMHTTHKDITAVSIAAHHGQIHIPPEVEFDHYDGSIRREPDEDPTEEAL